MIAPVGEKLLFEHTKFSAIRGGGVITPPPPPGSATAHNDCEGAALSFAPGSLVASIHRPWPSLGLYRPTSAFSSDRMYLCACMVQ